MEMKIDSYIKEQFGIENVDIRTYSPLTLAYIRDGIFDLVIRSLIVGKGNTKASQLHYQTSHIVKAETQAKIIEALEGDLTEEEADVYRRGRPKQSPRNPRFMESVRHHLRPAGRVFRQLHHSR